MNELGNMSELRDVQNVSHVESIYNDSERPEHNSFNLTDNHFSDLKSSYNDSERPGQNTFDLRDGQFIDDRQTFKETDNISTSDINSLSSEKKDVTDLQKKEIDSVESGIRELSNTLEKGNYGEMKMDLKLKENDYDRISLDTVTSLEDTTHKGIDGVYCNPNGYPEYIIADAKFGFAQLSDTQDGKQMSDNWIDKRLDDAVGKEKADEIRLSQLLDSNNVGKFLVHVDGNGNVSFDKLDSNAEIIERNVVLNA